MTISQNLAQQIVEAIHDVIKRDINLIDHQGIIIGSTDSARLGSFHEAGFQAVQTARPVAADDGSGYKGTRPGMNYPIFMDQQAIAAIGITGAPGQQKQYGFLATKITEVFLKEQQLNEEMHSENRMLHYLVTSLIQGNTGSPQALSKAMEHFKMDPAGQYAVLSAKAADQEIQQAFNLYLRQKDFPLSLYLYPGQWVVVLDQESCRRLEAAAFEQAFQGKLWAGLGNFAPPEELPRSYEQARLARSHARQSKKALCSIAGISARTLVGSLSDDMRRLYGQKVLHPLTDKDLETLNAYFQTDCSLKETAARLYIHKNTLQYQLDRITEKTALNPRSFQDAFALQLALLCYE